MERLEKHLMYVPNKEVARLQCKRPRGFKELEILKL